MASSALFAPYRAVGLVTGPGEGLSLQTLGSHAFLTTPAGRGYQVYDLAHLELSFASRQVPSIVRCVTVTLTRRRGLLQARARR
jgi:hypothetical protein